MTSITDIAVKPVSQITLADLATLIDLEAPETDILELKSALPLKKDAKGWGDGKLHDSERDGLLQEIVAFANTRGGRIFVGIAESSDHPKRASKLAPPIPRLADLVERLGDAFLRLQSGRRSEGLPFIQSTHRPVWMKDI